MPLPICGFYIWLRYTAKVKGGKYCVVVFKDKWPETFATPDLTALPTVKVTVEFSVSTWGSVIHSYTVSNVFVSQFSSKLMIMNRDHLSMWGKLTPMILRLSKCDLNFIMAGMHQMPQSEHLHQIYSPVLDWELDMITYSCNSSTKKIIRDGTWGDVALVTY